MMPKNSGTHSLENSVPMHVRSATFVGQAGAPAGDECAGCGANDTSADVACPPSDKQWKQAAEPSLPSSAPPEDDAEYEEIDDLTYERTGTLCFPFRVIERARATAGVGAGNEAARAPSSGAPSSEPPSSEPPSSAWSAIGHRVRDLRAASADKPGVTLLATIAVAGSEVASPAKRRAPPPPPSATKAKVKATATEDDRSSSSLPPPVMAPRSVPQPVVVAPPVAPPRRTSTVASRALSKVPRTIVASTSSPEPRHAGSSRKRETRSPAADPNAERTTRPSLRTRPRVIQSYPSLGQRLLAEVRRVPLAKRSLALGAGAAVLVAGVFLASSTLMPRKVPREKAEARPSAAQVGERAPRAERGPGKMVPPRPAVAAVVDARAALDARDARTLADAPAPHDPRVDVMAEDELQEMAPALPAVGARPLGARPLGARAMVGSNRRVPAPNRPHAACECFPGDPLCGCLD